MAKLVTIIIPCYNAEKCIDYCLNSVLSQTYSNLEIIVINDASKDNTLRILQNYEQHDRRISILSNQKQGGQTCLDSVESLRHMAIIYALLMPMIGCHKMQLT